MLTRNFRRKVKRLFYKLTQMVQQILKLPLVMIKKLLYQLLRIGFIFDRKNRVSPRGIKTRRNSRTSTAGFILPTVVLLLIVVSLVVTAILFRTGKRIEQVSGDRRDSIIYNVGTPAINRAKSKIEFLFKRDPSFPSGVPSEDQLQILMLDSLVDVSDTQDNYTFTGETRLDINGDGNLDNAWSFESDVDGDGNADTVAYSILLLTETEVTVDKNKDGDTKDPGETPTRKLNNSDHEKALRLLSRSGPLTLSTESAVANASCPFPELVPEKGWFAISNTSVRKNFQVNVIVAGRNEDDNGNGILDTGEDTNGNGKLDVPLNASKVVSAFEYNQDRQMDKGNKFGAWFRNDLELSPGPAFNWNGAIHTEGNLMMGGNSITLYLVSSPKSCIYTEDASEITTAQYMSAGKINYQGQAVVFNQGNNNFDGSIGVHIFPGAGLAPTGGQTFNKSSDSVKDIVETGSPDKLRTDPITLFTQDFTKSKYTDPTQETIRDPNWSSRLLSDRIKNKLVRKPYVDDTYRADNRWGPKAAYNSRIGISSNPIEYAEYVATPNKYGKLINDGATPSNIVGQLTLENPEVGATGNVGLDGYWEKRARVEGTRIIIGPRLELGNTFNWMDNEDPMYPPNSTTLKNLDRQRLALKDNLAAVQAGVIYHYRKGTDFPAACLALTAHPANQTTHIKSTTFNASPDGGGLPHTDFFNGEGTNGWEFNPPGNVTTANEYKLLIDDPKDPLRIALSNLAHFAGDTYGAFPPVQDTNDDDNTNDAVKSFGPAVHPYPYLTMWGDFSNLRRVIALLDDPVKITTYDDLSIADQTTLHVASCTLGMLAYNMETEQKIFEDFLDNQGTTMNEFGVHMWKLIDGDGKDEAVTCSAKVLGDGGLQVDEMSCQAQYKVGGTNISQDDWAQTKYGRNYSRLTDASEFYAQFTTQDYIDAIQADTSVAAAKKTAYIAILQNNELLGKVFGMDNDRLYGFVQGYTGSKADPASTWDPNTGLIDPDGSGSIKTLCDPKLFDDFASQETSETGIAISFCQDLEVTDRKYPSLYYLFPKYNHDQIGLDNPNNTIGAKDNQVLFDEDINKNGIIDTEDIDGDGHLDVAEDLDGDGMIDTEDTNGNGFLDTISEDTNNNGILDTEDTNGNGVLDKVNEDLDGDGHLDINEDLNNNGTCKKNNPNKEPDVDGDGRCDKVKEDINNNGVLDVSEDKNNNNVLDKEDKNNNGVIDSISEDVNGNGVLDTEDLDGDGHLDVNEDTILINGILDTEDANGNGFLEVANEYITDPYIYNSAVTDDINHNFLYRVVGDNNDLDITDDTDNDGIEDTTEFGYQKIALSPKSRASWTLSSTEVSGGINKIIDNTLGGNTTAYTVLLDKGSYNGRELMAVRNLDIDLELMHRDNLPIATTIEVDSNGDGAYTGDEDINGDGNGPDTIKEYWLPAKGIVYAFREDAVREDSIARPRFQKNLTHQKAWDACDTVAELTASGSNCLMNVSGAIPQDPPINPDTYISPKPVDYYSDPDRRPYGFRLRNGADLSRSDTTFGLSFISDQPTYIMGDFNLHSTDGTNTEAKRIEEFTQKLPVNWSISSFYNDRKDLNPNFAQATDTNGDGITDHWRPSEVLADATSVLSIDFCDGYIANGYPKNDNNTDCAKGISAYKDSVLVGSGDNYWLRANGTYTKNNANGTTAYQTPILVDRNAVVNYDANGSAPFTPVAITHQAIGSYNIGTATEARMNTILVGGITPSRELQGNGGFHNYPRFLENWSNVPLYLSGSFVQLNFSTYATGPFEAEGWEPGTSPVTGEEIGFYSPPLRRWGYDVALQYNPPGPIAERFISMGSPRNEFYQEINAEDHYVNNLFCANQDTNKNGKIDNNEDTNKNLLYPQQCDLSLFCADEDTDENGTIDQYEKKAILYPKKCDPSL